MAASLEFQHEVEQFLYHQSEVLDGRRWDEWLELFTAEGIYWMPADPAQTTGDGVPNIFYEDHYLMKVRVARVTHPQAWSQQPGNYTSHVVSNVIVERAEGDEIAVRSKFYVGEYRNDILRHFAGSYRHDLVRTPDGLRIKLQRVDLVNVEGPFEFVLQYWL